MVVGPVIPRHCRKIEGWRNCPQRRENLLNNNCSVWVQDLLSPVLSSASYLVSCRERNFIPASSFLKSLTLQGCSAYNSSVGETPLTMQRMKRVRSSNWVA